MRQRMMFSILFITLGIMMMLAFGGLLQSQEQEPWVGNVHIKLQKLSPTKWPEKGETFDVKVKVQSIAPNGHVRFILSGVSSWEGYAMNAGTESDSTPDLKLLTSDQTASQAGTTLN